MMFGKMSVKNYKIILILIFVFALFGCQKREKTETEGPQVIPVKVSSVKKADLKEKLFFVGDIKAKDQIDVFPKVSGKLIEKKLVEGDVVKKDDVLAIIDRDEVGMKFEPAPVVSPIEGVLAKWYLDRGASVSVSTPVAIIVDIDKVKVNIDVPEINLSQIQKLAKAKLIVDAYPDEEFEGQIAKISPIVDTLTRTAPIEVSVPNAEHKLKPGMFARIEIIVTEFKDSLYIPNDAVIRGPAEDYVFIVKDNKAYKRKIDLGITENENIQVLSGLSEGEAVVIMGQQRLKDAVNVIIGE